MQKTSRLAWAGCDGCADKCGYLIFIRLLAICGLRIRILMPKKSGTRISNMRHVQNVHQEQ